jgi:hypothetical protein
MTDTIRIRVLQTVRGNFILEPNHAVVEQGKEYPAKANKQGAISALCDNAEWLGMKPGEFEFLEAPEWVLRIWARYDSGIECRLKKK